MAKGSSGFDKSGKSSGLNSIPSTKDFQISKAPQITGGTEEQIKEATKIRNKIGRALVMYTIRNMSDGRPSSLYEIAKQGEEAIKKDIKNNPLVSSTSGKLRQEKINDAVEGYKDLAKRISRYNNIISNTSASFWLKNRTDQSYNYLNQRLEKKIDGK